MVPEEYQSTLEHRINVGLSVILKKVFMYAIHFFQVITPFRNLVLCADSRREMEEWISALKTAAKKEFYDVSFLYRAFSVPEDYS